MNILDKDLTNCIGCGNCENICKHKAITLKEDTEGFLYPILEIDRCINCGLCIKKCPLFSTDLNSHDIKKIKVIKSKNQDDLLEGSSGGFFPTLAKTLLKNNTIIYGAIFDRESKTILHSSTNKYQLKAICKSKYVQSNLNDIFIEIKSELKLGKTILFVGTPCQIKALKVFLGREYEQLITIDFICHGIPGQGNFKKYIELWEQNSRKKIIDLTFREKVLGWNKIVLKATFDDLSYEIKDSNNNLYYAFSHNYNLRKCCYKCKFAKNHNSDISMADAWHKKDPQNTGLSMISLNTIKGETIFNSVSNLFYIEEESTFIWNKYDVVHNYPIAKRNKFFKKYLALEYKDFDLWFDKIKKREKIKNKIKVMLGKIKNFFLKK